MEALGKMERRIQLFPLLPVATVYPSTFSLLVTSPQIAVLLKESWPLCLLAFPHTHPLWCGGYAQAQGALSLSGFVSVPLPTLTLLQGRLSVPLTLIKSSKGLPSLTEGWGEGKSKPDFIFVKR